MANCSITTEKDGKGSPHCVNEEYDREKLFYHSFGKKILAGYLYKGEDGKVRYEDRIDADEKVTAQFEIIDDDVAKMYEWIPQAVQSENIARIKFGNVQILKNDKSGAIKKIQRIGEWTHRMEDLTTSRGKYDIADRQNGFWITEYPGDADRQTWVYYNGGKEERRHEASKSNMKQVAENLPKYDFSRVEKLGRGCPRFVDEEYDVEAASVSDDLLEHPLLLYKNNQGELCYQEKRDHLGWVEAQLKVNGDGKTGTLNRWFDLQRMDATAPPSKTREVALVQQVEHGVTFFEPAPL